jgi:hypothetical protein
MEKKIPAIIASTKRIPTMLFNRFFMVFFGGGVAHKKRIADSPSIPRKKSRFEK